MELTETLTKIQKTEHLTDQQMADKLGCTRQLYQMTRTGKITVGLTILKGAVKAFPEALGDAIYFLTEDVDIVSKGVGVISNASQTTQDGKIRRFRSWLKGFVLGIKNLIANQTPQSKSRG